MQMNEEGTTETLVGAQDSKWRHWADFHLNISVA